MTALGERQVDRRLRRRSRPTAARGPRASAAGSSPSTTRFARRAARAASPRTRCTRSARRSASASSTAGRCSTCPTSRTAGRGRHERRHAAPGGGGEARFVEVQGTAEGMAFTPRELDSLLALAEGGLATITRLPARARRDRLPRRDERCCRARLRVGQSRQGRRDPSILRRLVDLVPRPTTSPTWSRTPTRCSATPGSRRSRSVEATGLPAVADDTGLEVDALDGAPGRVLAPAGRARLLVRRQPRTSCCASWRGVDRAAPCSAPCDRRRGPTAASSRSRASAADDHADERGERASATTRSSLPTRATADVRRDVR